MAEKLKSGKKKYDQGERVMTFDPLRDFSGSPVEVMLARFGLWFRSNFTRFVTVFALAAVAVVAVVSFFVWQSSRNRDSLVAFEKLLEEPVMTPGATTTAELPVKKLDGYLDNYGGDGAFLRATIKKIDYLMDGKSYAKAGEESGKVADELSDRDLKVYFRLKEGTCYEMAGEKEKALNSYREVKKITEEKSTLFRALALYGEGRILINQGKMEEGKKSIRSMMEMEDLDRSEQEFLRISATSFLLNLAGESN